MIQTLLQLIYEFLITGTFAVGGGLATLPFFQAMTNKHTWFSFSDLADMIAVSQSAPGAFGINLATYSGFKAEISNGLFPAIIGGIISVFALILPSIIIIIIISKMLTKFSNSKLVKGALYGLKPATTGLITAAGLVLLQISIITSEKFSFSYKIIDFKALALLIIILLVNLKYKKLHPGIFIAAAAVVGIVFKL